MNDNYEKNLARIQKIADQKGLILNSDVARIEKVVWLMGKSHKQYGSYFCPCKQTNDIPKLGEDVTCPCPELNDEIKENGQCGCRIFFRP